MENTYTYKSDNIDIKKSNVKPFFTFLLYLLKTYFKKTSVYVLIALTIIIPMLIYLIPVFAKVGANHFLSYFSTFFVYGSILLILFPSIMGLSATLSMFIDPQKNGIEILLVSKPINRYQIIWARILFLIIIALLVSFVAFFTYLITGAIINSNIDIELTILNQKFTTRFFDTAYWGSAVLNGAFFGPFLGFLTFGTIAGAIGIKASTKTTRALAIVLVVCSALVANSFPFFNIITYSSRVAAANKKADDSINNYLLSNNNVQLENFVDFSKTYENYYLDLPENQKLKIDSYNSSSYDYEIKDFMTNIEDFNFSGQDRKTNKKFQYTKYSINLIGSNDWSGPNVKREVIQVSSLTKLNDGTSHWIEKNLRWNKYPNWDPEIDKFRSVNVVDNLRAPTEFEYKQWINKKKSNILNNKFTLIKTIKLGLKNLHFDASGITAISYLNPLSAFGSIMQTTDSFMLRLTAMQDSYYSRNLLNNYDYNFKTSINESYVNLIPIVNNKQDPSWALALIWFTIDISLIVLISFAYQRKDFK